MFRSVRLTRTSIQIPEKHISAVMAIIGEFRLLHLIRIEDTHIGHMGYLAKIDTGLLEKLDALLERINRLLKEMSPLPPPNMKARIQRPDKAAFTIASELDSIEKETLGVLTRRRETGDKISQKQSLIKKLRFLEPAGVRLERLQALKYTGFMAGIVPAENLERLEESLSDIYHVIVPLEKVGKNVSLMALSLKDDLETLSRALKSSFFEAFDLPEHLNDEPARIISELEAEISALTSELAKLDQERDRLSERFGARLQTLKEQVILSRNLVKAQEKFGHIDHTYILSGWVPTSLFPSLKEKILDATGGEALVEQVDPEETRQIRSGMINIPILFNNPLLIRPFERLTTLYGTPSYQEIEPTIFLAVSFLLLFGMMFGDVGQGAVLFVAGYYIFRRLYRNMDYGIILMECGISSIIFGVLYGSVFGMETIIPPLWMHPMDNIGYFMKVSAFVGIGIISLGLGLNLVNIFRQRRFRELFSGSGLAGALFYWLLVGLLVRYLLAGELNSVEWIFAEISAALLILLMVLHRPAGILLRRLLHKEPERPPDVTIGMAFVESFIEVMDDLLKYLANTVSFVRVAAFAITHAGLFIAIFSMADMIKNTHGGGFFYWMVIILGNLIVICLEGLIVSVQTVRLEYYEFFGKFFKGGGRPFKPIFDSR